MIDILRHALLITGFVFVMMLVIEYINILTAGVWGKRLSRNRLVQYVLASALGFLPGCLGAFAVVAMYSHRVVSLGAVVAAMIATAGDESFVMLALFPGRAALIFAMLFLLGIVGGAAADGILRRYRFSESLECEGLEIHDQACDCFPRGRILKQWRECIPARGILAVFLGLSVVAIVTGQVGPQEWNWIRQTLLVVSAVALFIVATVHDHFLEDHMWNHIAKKHIPRIFLWTLGALIVFYVLTDHLDISLETIAGRGRYVLLLTACLVGLIPQSGPHMIFVTFYAKGAMPISILLANSIVQEGHGLLPLLADSKRSVLAIKVFKFILGFVIGAAAIAAGY
jgi:hypothetical protein